MVWRILIAVLLVAIAVGVVVEHTMTSIQIRTIATVRSANVSGGTVAIRGTITYARNNRFVLQDKTGTAELSTCPLWYKRVYLHEGDQVTAVGEVLRNPPLTAKCDFVLSVYRAFRGGEVIQVRRGPGKPPWASYRPETAPGY